MKKELFLELIDKARKESSLYWLDDIIKESLKDLKVYGLPFNGYVACINSLESYYACSMEMTKYSIGKQLFKEDWPIYTMTNDSCPTRYLEGTEVKNSILANGCQIEGTIINSIIGRNVIVKKGAIIKDSVVLPGAYIGEDCEIKYAVVDRYAHVNKVKELNGTPDNPIYVKRRDRI